MKEEVLLVNERDEVLGAMEKLRAHQEGRLHRAFSVIVFNDRHQMLIHQRADAKYHCGGLWTNACCSHPRLNETLAEAVQRRLMEEMGFTCDVQHVDEFIYRAELGNGLIEHEYDHVFVGTFNGSPKPSPEEVKDWKYIDLAELRDDMKKNPSSYTFWFREIMETRIKHILPINYDESL